MSTESESVTGKTPVLLGYPDTESDQTATALDTRIGGYSIWLNLDSPVDSLLATCKSCSSVMSLLLQAYAALEDTLYERVIYLYACNKPACWRRAGSVRAVRGIMLDEARMQKVAEKQKKDEEKRKQKAVESAAAVAVNKPRADLGSMLFGSGFGDAPNPFGSQAESSNSFNSSKSFNHPSWSTAATPTDEELSTMTESMQRVMKLPSASKERAPVTPWPSVEHIPNYSSWFVYVENEYLRNKSERQINQRIEVMASGNAADAGPDEWSAVPDSSSDAIDQVFQKFSDTVADNPEQIVRYDRQGAPLFYTKHDDIGRLLISKSTGVFDSSLIPQCPVCGAERVFELQLMPYAIQVLEQGSGIDMINGMEWGTIMVATCKRDCTPSIDKNGVGYAEEWVGVQWEESK
ncbi:programmed cell death protein 2 [Lipomyces arxii]|uniref:programmed cell death protein 2 n=1 Tax=Lipomyces arxii TaxID=56418 RepID=UPI0034CE71DD